MIDINFGLVINILKYMFEIVRFVMLRFGKDCNVDGSYLFMDVKCSVLVIRDERKVMMVRNFKKVFKCGIDFMNEFKSGDMNFFKNMEKNYKVVIIVLVRFLEEKGMIWFYFIV